MPDSIFFGRFSRTRPSHFVEWFISNRNQLGKPCKNMSSKALPYQLYVEGLMRMSFQYVKAFLSVAIR